LAESGGGGRTGKDAERGGPLPHPRIFSKTFLVVQKQHWLMLGGMYLVA